MATTGPTSITAVRLEMRQRKLCFDAPSTQPLTLFYGDAALTAPQYDYARLFAPSDAMHAAQLGPEQLNTTYRDRPDARPLTDRHPHLLWIVLLGVICILAVVAIRSIEDRAPLVFSSLANRRIDFANPVRRFENLARLRSIGRPNQTIVVHHVDQVSGAAIADPQSALQQRGACLAKL